MYNMYITINIKSTTGILTAINVTDMSSIRINVRVMKACKSFFKL